MVLPLVLAGAMVAMTAIEALYNVYSTQKTTEASDAQARYQQTFYGGAQLENRAYFDRYIRMHHLQNRKILYPYRTGMNFNASQLYGSNSQLVKNEYSRYGSYVHGGASTGRAGIIGYGAGGFANRYHGSSKPVPDYMYG